MRGNEDGLTRRQLLPAGTVVRSRALRRNAGEPERLLWRLLRDRLPQAGFRRQVPLGPYHADFCSHRWRLVVEIDGDDHVVREARDAARTAFLNGEGYRVLRFSNADVMDQADGVLTAIAHEKGGRP